MRREVELRKRLHSLEALGEAVRAMKSLSAHHFRAARNAVEPARSYREGVERILGLSGATLAAGGGAGGLLVVGAELGLCGGYNAQIVEAGERRRRELGPGPTFCVGHRAAALLGRRGVEIARVYAGPTSVRGITGLLLKLAEDVLSIYAREDLSSFDIVSSRFGGVGATLAASTRLLPVDPRGAGEDKRPRYVGADHLASAAIREFLYITIHGLLLDALASEHGARLSATQSAETWLDKRSEAIGRRLRATRREASTQEMIEIASGARQRRGGRG